MKPNILIIVIDSMRADHVSCYGYHRKTTPNIDRLAEEGCVFETAITAAPFSPASYASIFSNLYPHQHGVNGDTVRVWPEGLVSLAQKMREKDYYTFGVSNNAFVGQPTNAVRGFDAFVEMFRRSWHRRTYSGLIRRLRGCVGDRLCDWLEPNYVRWPEMRLSARSMKVVQRHIQKSQSPFFGFVILMDPHGPYDGRRREFSGYSRDASDFLRRINDGKMWARLMAHRSGLSASQLRVAYDLYDAEILHADQCVGTIVAWLRRRQLLDDTIVIVTADHGEAFGEHGVWGHGFCLNDCLTRVPLVVRCPRYWSAGLRSKALVQMHDIHDLCCSVASTGGPTPDHHPMCLTQAQDNGWAGREYVFSEFPVQTGTLALMRTLNPEFKARKWGQGMWAVRSRDWRYIEYDDGQCELYDLRTDSGETVTVHEIHADVRQELAERLAAHRDDGSYPTVTFPEPSQDALDERVLERLRALGYVD